MSSSDVWSGHTTKSSIRRVPTSRSTHIETGLPARVLWRDWARWPSSLQRISCASLSLATIKHCKATVLRLPASVSPACRWIRNSLCEALSNQSLAPSLTHDWRKLAGAERSRAETCFDTRISCGKGEKVVEARQISQVTKSSRARLPGYCHMPGPELLQVLCEWSSDGVAIVER